MNKIVRLFSISSIIVCVLFSPLFADEIHNAARDDDLDKIKLLLQDNPNLIHLKTDTGKISLHFAAERGHLHVLKFLIENGSDVNENNEMFMNFKSCVTNQKRN